MKKHILFLILLVSWQYAMADVITEDQARKCAAEFFNTFEKPTKAAESSPGEFKLVYSFPEIETRSSSSEPELFVFERETGGFAIVAGDDVARPVLGYSLDGYFPVSDMPDNLRAMFQWYADVIAFAREQNWKPAPNKEVGFGLDPNNTVQLHTANWSQDHPFNDLVAEINGQRPPIGCVATAISIIMRYHQWPVRGNGELPSYDYNYNGTKYHIDGFSLGHEYDWSKMPDYYWECKEDEAEQLARLFYDVAVMCKMNFAPGGSSSSSSSVLDLTNYFDYDKQLVYLSRSMISSSSIWEQYIVDEIDAGRPVLYSGKEPGINSGHAFVIDGYNGCYFSINYGWAGYFNGFYTLTPVEGHDEELVRFSIGQNMAIRIMPNHSGEPDPSLAISVLGMPFVPIDFALKKDFNLSYVIVNRSAKGFIREYCYVLYNREGTIKEIISPVFQREIQAKGTASGNTTCRITGPLTDGDQILLCVKDPNTGEWIPVLQPRIWHIVFTTRSLSELAYISYVQEAISHDRHYPTKKRDLLLTTYRDCNWEIYGANNKKLIDNKYPVNISLSGEGDSPSFYTAMSDPDDPLCDMMLYDIWLPTGNYRLYVRNPATGEEIEIKLEL
ncbi:MAG: C10 family peptidase [Bacteroidales bacterium]|nr:C10 family peptidase [Bacteroidales bacterium]